MAKNRKAILYISSGVIGLIILVLLFIYISNSQMRSEIPELANLNILSQPVQEQITDALGKARNNPSSANLGMLGMVYHSSGNYEQAAQCYKLAIRRSKREWIWNYYLGYLDMEMGHSEAVIENFSRVARKNPDIDLAWYYIGEEYKNLGKNKLAEESFSKITTPENKISVPAVTNRVDNFPLNTYARFQLSRIYSETGRNDLAEKTLKEIIEANRSFGPAYRLLGNIYSMKGDSVLSRHYLARANDLLVFSPPVDTLVDRLVLMSRSELYLLKKIDEAERGIYSEWTLKLVNNALKYMPDNKYLISKAVNICLWTGLDKQAIAFTDRHISYFKENFNEMKNTGMKFFMNGIYLASIKYLTIAFELAPEDVEVQRNLALSYWYAGDKQKTHAILNQLLEKNRNNQDVIADVANVLFFNLRESERAAGYLAKLLQHSPSNPKVQKLAGGIAEKNGKIQEAIAMYEASVSGDPEELTTIKYLGNLLISQEMWAKAISHYRRALEYHPNDPDFLERLGTLLVSCPDWSLRNIEEGREYSERAFVHISSRPNTLLSAGKSLAFAYAMLGDKQNAITTIRQTINICRQENLPQSTQAELENLYNTFQAMDN